MEMDELKMKKSSELASRDSLIDCLYARVSECEDEKVNLEQENARLSSELQQLRDTNMLLHATIKRLQNNRSASPSLEDEDRSPRESPASIRNSNGYSSSEEWNTLEANYHDPTSDMTDEECEVIHLNPPDSSASSHSLPPPPHASGSVDDLLAFLVWLFLHIAVYIDSHRAVYQNEHS